jgi:NAD(P)H-nitrite reductase large subunit
MRVADFDKLLITTGAKPIRPTIPGVTLSGVYYLHTLADAEAQSGARSLRASTAESALHSTDG